MFGGANEKTRFLLQFYDEQRIPTLSHTHKQQRQAPIDSCKTCTFLALVRAHHSLTLHHLMHIR